LRAPLAHSQRKKETSKKTTALLALPATLAPEVQTNQSNVRKVISVSSEATKKLPVPLEPTAPSPSSLWKASASRALMAISATKKQTPLTRILPALQGTTARKGLGKRLPVPQALTETAQQQRVWITARLVLLGISALRPQSLLSVV